MSRRGERGVAAPHAELTVSALFFSLFFETVRSCTRDARKKALEILLLVVWFSFFPRFARNADVDAGGVRSNRAPPPRRGNTRTPLYRRSEATQKDEKKKKRTRKIWRALLGHQSRRYGALIKQPDKTLRIFEPRTERKKEKQNGRSGSYAPRMGK